MFREIENVTICISAYGVEGGGVGRVAWKYLLS